MELKFCGNCGVPVRYPARQLGKFASMTALLAQLGRRPRGPFFRSAVNHIVRPVRTRRECCGPDRPS
jgi:hypothetical protein